jgi:hypothetical protein
MMRLERLNTGHRLRNRAFLGLIRKMSHEEPHDVLKMLHYRPSFFGGPFCVLTQEMLRGPSDWTVGERESFAALTSRLNQCLF